MQQLPGLNPTKVLVSLIIGVISMCGCKVKPEGITPKEFIYVSHATMEIYHQDSIKLTNMVQTLLDSGHQAFYPSYYDEEARFQIKEILYSPDAKRFVFFVVTHVKAEKLLGPDPKDLFNGDFFIGEKNDENEITRINWIPAMGYATNTSADLTFEGLKRQYFYELSTLLGHDRTPKYGYNVDDIRFWSCKIWDKKFVY